MVQRPNRHRIDFVSDGGVQRRQVGLSLPTFGSADGANNIDAGNCPVQLRSAQSPTPLPTISNPVTIFMPPL
jgi:hypothetical protein